MVLLRREYHDLQVEIKRTIISSNPHNFLSLRGGMSVEDLVQDGNTITVHPVIIKLLGTFLIYNS